MTRTEAHELLYAAQAGCDVSHAHITQALIITGDIEDDAPVVRRHRPAGTWERFAMSGAYFRPAGPWDGIAA